MNYKILFLVILGINLIISIFFDLLKFNSLKRKVPESLEFLTKEEDYKKWQTYLKRKLRLGLIEDIVSVIPMFFLVGFNVFASVSSLVNKNWIVQLIILLLFAQLIEFIIKLPFDIIDTYKIEEEYGFNNTKVGTFIVDQVFGLILNAVISFLIGFIFFGLFSVLPHWASIIVCTLIFIGVSFLIQFLFPYFAKLRNKFTPLEEGELKSKLMDLMNKNNFKVEGIYVVNESKRSTKENAYFAGSGKSRRIVIYDNLIANHTPNEIVAVFAHELGHAKCKHHLKSLPLSFINVICMVLLIYVSTIPQNLSIDFGFSTENYAIMYLFAGELIDLFMVIFSIINNTISRKHEYEADTVAAQNGYADDLKLSLINLTKKNYGLLCYNPILEFCKASHPSLENRIKNLEKNKISSKKEGE